MSAAENLRRPQIDGLRCILFIVVFCVHYAPDPMRLGHFGYALPVFFVMSGFVITQVLLSADHLPLGERLRVFYIRRFLRIVPVYFLVLFPMIALGLIAYPAWYVSYLVNIKLFLLSLDPSFTQFNAWFAHAWRHESWHFWSLSVEEQFYIVFPLALYLAPARHRVAMMICLVVASIAVHVFFIRYLPNSFYGALLPVCMEYFAWGAAFSLLEARKRLGALNASWTFALSWAAILLTIGVQSWRDNPGVLQFVTKLYQTPIALALGFMIWALWSLPREHPVTRFLSFRPFVYLGEISYTCYLVHLVALDIFLATGLQ
ncbi:MAG: acyltransferase, partial [Burkholderiales bacterium]